MFTDLNVFVLLVMIECVFDLNLRWCLLNQQTLDELCRRSECDVCVTHLTHLIICVSGPAQQFSHSQSNSNGEQCVLPQNERRLLQIPVRSGFWGDKEG